MSQDMFNFEDDIPGEPVAMSVSVAIGLINDQLFQIAGPNLVIEGEVSDYGVSQGKWVRFVLKDLEDGALLKCFMTTYQLKVPIEDGDRIIVVATPKIYPKYGQFTLNVNSIEPVGEGALAKKLLALKKQLESEGLFEEARKRLIPEYPNKIGIITSRDAAAFTDFVRIIGNRWGGVEIDLAHVHVQGELAVREIAEAIKYFNGLEEAERPDVLVLTRGGGSLEDLMAFNAEAVVRAVFGSSIPIVVGVGHERDESLAELAADVRASTPSNAAEIIVPDKEAVIREVEMMKRRIVERVEDAINHRKLKVEHAVLRVTGVLQVVGYEVERVVSNIKHIGELIKLEIDRYSGRIDGMLRYLKELEPERILRRGYSIVRKGDVIIRDSDLLDKGDVLEVQFAEGKIKVEVND